MAKAREKFEDMDLYGDPKKLDKTFYHPPVGGLISSSPSAETKASRKVRDIDGFQRHCQVAALILRELALDPHTKYHVRGAVREASNKVSTESGSAKERAPCMSVAAGHQMESGDFSNLIFEHAVPISLINERVLALKDPSPESIQALVLRWTLLSVITQEEHKRLTQAGLSKTMPDNWDRRNLKARYDAVGIKLVPNRYKEWRKKRKA